MDLPPDRHEHYPPYRPQPRQSNRGQFFLAFILLLMLGWLAFREFGGRLFAPRYEPRTVTARGELADFEKTTINLFENASPSVVFITTTASRRNLFGLSVGEVPQGTGSGFIWDQAGNVVTNFHVIQSARSASVTLSDHSSWPAELVGVAPDKDIAVLRINAPVRRLHPISIGESANLRVGQAVYAIGNPFGLDQTLTTGIVSALGRSIPTAPTEAARTIDDVIQTDAAINPGNSGGPLLDSAGRLIGMNTAIFSPSGSNAGIGFAIPVDTINRVVPQLIERGEVRRPRLGIEILPDNFARQFGTQGVVIGRVVEGGPAETAGLRGTDVSSPGDMKLGDVIQAINGRQVRTTDQLLNVLDRHSAGDKVQLSIRRGNETLTVEVVLE